MNMATEELTPPTRLLMGPGPSTVHNRVLRSMATPLVGHLDPYFIEIMKRTQDLLRYVLRLRTNSQFPFQGREVRQWKRHWLTW